jgi:hypothetical protein
MFQYEQHSKTQSSAARLVRSRIGVNNKSKKKKANACHIDAQPLVVRSIWSVKKDAVTREASVSALTTQCSSRFR